MAQGIKHSGDKTCRGIAGVGTSENAKRPPAYPAIYTGVVVTTTLPAIPLIVAQKQHCNKQTGALCAMYLHNCVVGGVIQRDGIAKAALVGAVFGNRKADGSVEILHKRIFGGGQPAAG